LANWNSAIPWVGAAYHGWTNVEYMDLAQEVFADFGVFVVGEAYGKLHGWAEASIKVADHVLEKYLDVPRPWDFPVDDIAQFNRPTSSSSECTPTDNQHSDSSSPAAMQAVSLEDVRLHDSEDDCWSVLHGFVYDLEELITSHAGPAAVIVEACGRDATADYAAHHSISLLSRLTSKGIGPVAALSMSDIAEHAVEGDCWSLILDNVYDLSAYNHSGPQGPITAICGINGTEAYVEKHNTTEKLDKISHLILAPYGSAPVTPLSMSDIAEHAVEGDCWSLILDNVYDLSAYNHSGPQGPITAICGINGTEAYVNKHNTTEKLDKISDLILGPYASSQVVTINGGGSGGGGGGGGGGSTVDPFCFTAEALVQMADGSLKPIKEVQEGDVVSTGTGLGNGIVTEKLIHPVGREVAVAILDTAYGTLIGTPTHPMLHKGNWVELGKLKGLGFTLSSQFVDTFYNLEIDADMIHGVGGSSHSYVVNGQVASGLGDNEILNRLFPRQEVWKEKTAEAIVE
jgi:cytochrome b involved in lipid metabolism